MEPVVLIERPLRRQFRSKITDSIGPWIFPGNITFELVNHLNENYNGHGRLQV